MLREQLIDGHGREIGDVRMSVTDRCNFRCQYCMPAEGLPWLERDAILSFEEIERLVRVLSEMGVGAVRLTGGEPLVRRDFPRLAAMLAALPRVEDLALTTNGFLLERDAAALVEAGIDRFNVSIDSLQRDRFFALTRRDALPRVLRGLEVLARLPRGAPDQGQRRRDARVHRAGGAAVRRVRARAPLRGPLHRVHAARRRPRLDARAGPHRRRDPRVDRRDPTRSSPNRASRARRRASTASRTARAGSASSTRSASRSAATATGSASPPRAGCAPACSRSTRPTCAGRCARVSATTSSRRSSATRSGARSSSTASTSPASSSRADDVRHRRITPLSRLRPSAD